MRIPAARPRNGRASRQCDEWIIGVKPELRHNRLRDNEAARRAVREVQVSTASASQSHAGKSRYHEIYARSMRDPVGFWTEAAADIDWYEPATKVFDPAMGVYGRWFVGATCNTCFNAVDRHVARGRGAQSAIIYDSPVTGAQRAISYAELLAEVKTLAAILRDLGVREGDRVIIYMPMVPEAAFAMLACARIGAIHSVVFGGFAANELATRLDDAQPKVILSASCGIEPGRIVKYKPLLDEAIDLASAKPEACLILFRQRKQAALVPGAGSSRSRPRRGLGEPARRRHQGRRDRRLRAGGRHRSALHPLHLGHDRQAEGRGARQRRPHGRAEMVDAAPLRRQSRRGVVVGLRCRLGGGS